MPPPVTPDEPPKRPRRFRLFVPILAGATLRERMVACLGALIGIGLTGLICGQLFGHAPNLPLIVAPMGASAVLLFAIPASPLAQPWSIIGGNTISALVGVAVGRVVHDPALAIGIAASLAIAAMSFTRCLHPPGGAAALTAVLGGPAVAASGFLFPFVPVALNSVLLVALGFGFHKLSRRAYPHVAAATPANTHRTQDPPPQMRTGFRADDVDAALAALDETFDIDRGDLDRLMRQVELQAMIRSHGTLRCADIMSRDVIKVDQDTSADQARSLLLEHNIRTLPVVDGGGRLVGTVGLRELVRAPEGIDGLHSAAATAAADDPALALLPVLTDGRTHAVVVVDGDRRIQGLITQADLLAALARALPSGDAERPGGDARWKTAS
jgi:CBS domain-containing membrane protein